MAKDEWTLESLKELLELEIKDLRRAMDERRDTYLRMTNKSERSMDERLKSMNEFRNQLGVQAASFVTREEWDLAHRALELKVDALEDRLIDRININTNRVERAEGAIIANNDRVATKRLDSGQLISTITAVLFAVSVVVGVVVAFLNH